MDSPAPRPLSQTEVRTDLEAALGARKELGSEIEDELVGAFLDRLQTQIDLRVQQQIDQRLAAMPLDRKTARQMAKAQKKDDDIVASSLGIAIPLVVVAGIWGHEVGVAAVIACVVIINVLHLILRRQS